MKQNDSVYLLKECDAGAKMAIASFDEVLDKVQDPTMKEILSNSRSEHVKIRDEVEMLLADYNTNEKEPNPIAKGMSWLKTNAMMMMDESDATVADLMIDGCNMGVKSLHKYINQYPAANSNCKDLCDQLVSIEDALCKDLRKYL